MWSLDPLQLHIASLEERHVGTTAHEVAYDSGYECLAGQRVARDSRGVVHGRAEELVGFAERVPCVDAHPNGKRRGSIGEVAGEVALDRRGTCNGASCTGEREHGPVALPFDDRTVMSRRHLLDQSVVLSQER